MKLVNTGDLKSSAERLVGSSPTVGIMDRETRELLKAQLDKAARERVKRGYLDCDPESLTRRALEAQDLGYDEIAQALINFRDKVVNVLLGEGWTLERIEQAAFNYTHKER